MTSEAEPIKVRPGSELALLLEAASRAALLLEQDGVRYRLHRDDLPFPPDDRPVATTIAGIRAAAGGWSGIDPDAFKAYIAERRRGSRRPPVVL